MRKRVMLTLMLVAALLLTSGCGLIVKDLEVDKQTAVIEVAGKTITKGEVLSQVESTLDYQSYIYQMYGMSFDRTDPKNIADAVTQTLDGMVRQVVLEQKETELGMNVFTPEEETALQTEVDEEFAKNAETVKSQYFAETELTGEELDKAVADKMTELGYGDKETTLSDKKKTKAYDKLKEDVVKDLQVTQDEIMNKYNEKLAAAKTEYEGNLTAYGTAVRNGTTVYYRPVGYRYVKNILRKLSEEDTKVISDLETQISEKESQISTMDTSLSALNVDPTQDTPEEAKSRQEMQANKDQFATEVADLRTQLDATKEAAYAKVQPSIDEILQKHSEGVDFDALMEEYGEDDGMKASPAKEEGYLVCTGDTTWVPEFTQAAMELKAIGDVSAPVRTSFGIHLLQYASDLTPGEVPVDEVKETLSSEVLTSKQDELFESTMVQWVSEAGAKVYADRMN